MKGQLKYCLSVCLFLLLSIYSLRANTATCTQEQKSEFSYFSQDDTANDALQALSYLISHMPNEGAFGSETNIIPDNYQLKYILLSFLPSVAEKSAGDDASRTDRFSYARLHPRPVGYYIYTLRKIVI